MENQRKASVPLLRNNALLTNPYLRDQPDGPEGWSQFIRTLNAQQVFANIVIDSAGFIRMGQTDYDTGTGFWMGDKAGTPKFSIGNSAGNKLTWNGTTLAVTGSITAVSGAFTGSVTVGSAGSLSAVKASSADTTNGWWLGTDGATGYDLIVGDANSYLGWDGSSGKLTLLGDFAISPNAYTVVTPVVWTGFAVNPTQTSTTDFFGDKTDWVWSAGTGTSNSTSFSLEPVLSGNSLKALGASNVFIAIDNGNKVLAYADAGGTTWTMYKYDVATGTFSSTAWTNAGTKGFLAGTRVTFMKYRQPPMTGGSYV